MQASAGSKADAVESFASLRRVAAELAATAREVRAESVAVIEEAVALRRDTVALLAAIVLAKRLRDDALRVGILLGERMRRPTVRSLVACRLSRTVTATTWSGRHRGLSA